MFTGIVQESAPILALERNANALTLEVACSLKEARQWELGASVAVNGICLTIVKNTAQETAQETVQKLRFEASSETLDRTTLGELRVGERVHLERALRVGDPLGGHWVSGHVDAVGRVERVEPHSEFCLFEFALEGVTQQKIAPFLVEKGSITVDGVSLTVNQVRDEGTKSYFQVMCIPHTLQLTRFGQLRPGDRVNLEADLLAKYICRNQEFQQKGSH